ncbi:maltase 1-like [Planococcus citri]|uniref:maltase 1-like n=1 Tax=Planococcus citri TaxID=170843 RepID=UPI0031F7C66D
MNFKSTIFLIFLFALTGAKYSGIGPPLDWWQKIILYQIYPRSLQDTNGDGIGDLKGITQRVQHFNDIEVDAVWLSPIFKSPQLDLGYDISNYTEIDSSYGTMEDFMEMMKTYQSRGIKVILDFVPNHTSDQHPWFKKSVKKIKPYDEYYVWHNPKGWDKNTPIPPNNWRSLLNDSAWHFNSERQQFYFAQFLKQEPELNFRCKYVIEELKNVLRFYLDKGVNGFRTDSGPFLVEDAKLRDEPPTKVLAPGSKKTDYVNQQHIYTLNQPETFEVLRQFREVLDSYTQKGGLTRILVIEAYSDTLQIFEKYYGSPTEPIAHIPFNFPLITKVNDSSTAIDFKKAIVPVLNAASPDRWPNWVTGNHDNPRVPTRFEPSAIDQLNFLDLLLPGTAVTYQGEEIGMEDTKITPDQNIDPISPTRIPERTPFQWDSSLHAGFSNTKGNTWEPVNPNYYWLNLMAQKNSTKSHYNIYKSLAKLRLKDEFLYGDFKSYIISEWVFAFTRSLPEKNPYIIVLNLNNEQEYVNLIKSIPNLPNKLNLCLASGNSEHNPGDEISPAQFPMRPKSAVVLSVGKCN